MAPSALDETDKPLDPEVERVRRKLMRFMGINLAILFVAVMAVLAGIVYKSTMLGESEPAAQQGTPGRLELPAGAQILSHELSGHRLTVYFRKPDGDEAIALYDLNEQRSAGTIEIVRESEGE